MSKVLLTSADISDILGIDEAEIPQRIVDWGKAEVEKMLCKKYDAVEDEVEEFILRDNITQDYLQLSQNNITSISSITYRRIGIDSAEASTIEAEDYYLESDTSMVYFTSGLYNNYIYAITYTYGGVAIADIDRQLQFLVILRYLLKYKSDLFTTNHEVSSEKIGDYAISYNTEKLQSKPELIDADIERLKKLAGGGDNYFIGLV
jgi:hypothetical protein